MRAKRKPREARIKRQTKVRTKAQQAAYDRYMEAMYPEIGLRDEMIAARLRAGLSQAGLAERMGTLQPGIARLEAGRSLPSFATLKKMALATGSRLVVRLEEGGDAFK